MTADATRRKVLVLTPWYPSAARPTEYLFVREMVRAAQLFDDLTVLHCPPAAVEGLAKTWQLEEVRDDSITGGIPTFRVSHRPLRLRIASHLVYVWSIQRAFRRLWVGGHRPDVVHCQEYKASLPAILLGKKYRLPVIITEHSSDFARQRLSPLHRRLSRWAFPRADLVLPVSRALQHSIEGHGIHGQFRVVPNIVDTALFAPAPARPPADGTCRILTVGTMNRSHNKGQPLLLQALSGVSGTWAPWHLDIIGDGATRGQYEQLARDLGIADHVTFRGFLPKPEVAALMRQADLLVVSSLFETFSVVAAEALACGVPVLATRCGGPEEFITDEVGVLVPPGDSEALARGLREIRQRLHTYSPVILSQYANSRFSQQAVGTMLHDTFGSAASRTN